MRLGGLQKMTLLDFPGRVACTVFTLGCNFRCPFCHNTPLVLPGSVTEADPSTASRSPSPASRGGFGAEEYPQEEFFRFLAKRQGLLDGVAITGGEPLLHRDAADFIRQIRALGYAVKLDTNGAFPERLREILEAGLVDYVAMDIKNSRERYAVTAGIKEEILRCAQNDRTRDLAAVVSGHYGELGALGRNDGSGTALLSQVEKSVRLLLESGIDYEFRTTLVDELHEPADFAAIGQWIRGAKRYFIQGFVDSGDILGGEAVYHAASKEKAEACLAAVLPFVPNAQLRGID